MVSYFQVSDRNIVGLLLLLRSKGEITTSGMAEINQYDAVKKAAIRLQDAGLITSQQSGARMTRVLWKLTPDGMEVANSLHDAEVGLTKAFGLEKYYKGRVNRGV